MIRAQRLLVSTAMTVVLATGVAGLPAGVTPAAAATTTCKPLAAYPRLKVQLLHIAAKGASQALQARNLYYGHCGSTSYAELYLFGGGTGLTDQPTQFRKIGTGAWKVFGDDGCDPTNRNVPATLKKRWNDCTAAASK